MRGVGDDRGTANTQIACGGAEKMENLICNLNRELVVQRGGDDLIDSGNPFLRALHSGVLTIVQAEMNSDQIQ